MSVDVVILFSFVLERAEIEQVIITELSAVISQISSIKFPDIFLFFLN